MRKHHQVTGNQPHRRGAADGKGCRAVQEHVELGDRGALHAKSPWRREVRQAVHHAADPDVTQQAAEAVLSRASDSVHDTSAGGPELPDLTSIMSDQTLPAPGRPASMDLSAAPDGRRS